MFKILETEDYKGLSELFYRNGLEIEPGGEPEEELIKCWEIIDEDTGTRAGGVVLEKRDGEFVVADLAVEQEYRGRDLGTLLMERIMEEARALGGARIMLVAKIPDYYKKIGFMPMEREKAPDISNCFTCKRFGKECFPEIMYRELK